MRWASRKTTMHVEGLIDERVLKEAFVSLGARMLRRCCRKKRSVRRMR